MQETVTRPRRHRRVVATVLVLAGLVAAVGVGAFASFNAQASNPGNLFADGTLVLSNSVNGRTACLSTGGGSTDANVNDKCDALFDASVKKPGDVSSGTLALKNDGSVDMSKLVVFSKACTDADAVTEPYHGTGNPCGKIQLTIQAYADAGFSKPTACVFGASSGVECNFSDPGATLAAFQSKFSTAATGLTIGNGLASGDSAYLKVSVQLPADADNTFQGRQASIDFNWFAEQ